MKRLPIVYLHFQLCFISYFSRLRSPNYGLAHSKLEQKSENNAPFSIFNQIIGLPEIHSSTDISWYDKTVITQPADMGKSAFILSFFAGHFMKNGLLFILIIPLVVCKVLSRLCSVSLSELFWWSWKFVGQSNDKISSTLFTSLAVKNSFLITTFSYNDL